jgi:hypothetical protein
MLDAKPTKKGAGLEIFGHPEDFESLHETLHTLCESAPGGLDQHEHALSLAYEIRKAFEGQREVAETEQGVLVGTPLLWPHALFYTSYFRNLAAYCPTTKADQANLYRLEDCIETAIAEYDAKIGLEVIELYPMVGKASGRYWPQYVEDICYQFLFGGGSGKMRFRRLPALIRALHELSPEYREYADLLQQEADRLHCSPGELRDTRDWPEIDW